MRYCIILCGGVGSRFWPFSREKKPKQFIDFLGTGRSLLQMTVDRVRNVVSPEHILLMTNEAYADLIAEQLPEVPRENILLEPSRRNTGPCIYWAARHILVRDPEASMIVLPSDHMILKEIEFVEAMQEGFDFVEKNESLLTLGIKPRYPNTGYGYIQACMACVDFPDILKVKSFTEKPDKKMAELFISTGEFYWNSGIFMWSAKTILKAFADNATDIVSLFHGYEKKAKDEEKERLFIAGVYPKARSISIDYAIMEKANNVYMKPVDLGWSDLGTWNALYETSPKNQEANVTQNCKAMLHNCSGSVFACGPNKVIVASGLKNYIVADNENALLIYPLAEEQKIRQVVNEVKDHFGNEYV